MDNERTSRSVGTLHHLRAILLLPGMVTAVIPALMLTVTGLDTFGLWHSVPTTTIVLPLLGLLLIGLGLVLMVATIRLYMTVGKHFVFAHTSAKPYTLNH